MGINSNKKSKTPLRKVGLLFLLLAFSLPSSLLTTALSLEMQPSVLSSSGSIIYSVNPANSTLLVTDSTPEGPIPYKIDEDSRYQTGSTYSIEAGLHTIELSSPYTSPISNITYYLAYWQDGPTDNPRNVMLAIDTTVNLHGIYSTTPEPPLPPPPPPQNGSYVAYAGFESSNWQSQNGFGDVYNYFVATGGGGTDNWQSVVGAKTYQGQSITPYSGSGMLEFSVGPSPPKRWSYVYQPSSGYFQEIYQSAWMYLPKYPGGWHDIFEIRGSGDAEGRFMIKIFPSYWWIGMGSVYGEGGEDWNFRITYGGSISEGGTRPRILYEWNPVELPIGRWFKWELYCYRSTNDSNGTFIMWITDPNNPDTELRNTQVLLSVKGRTAWIEWNASKHSVYGWRWYGPYYWGQGDTWVYWLDDVYIYDYNAHIETP